MDVIETGPAGTTLRDDSLSLPSARFAMAHRRRLRAMDAYLSGRLAGRVEPVTVARLGRLSHNPQSLFSRFRLCLNATPQVFGYCFQNVPAEFQPVSLAGRLTYAVALAWIAFRKLWRQDIGFVRLPGNFIWNGRKAQPEELEVIRQGGSKRYRLLQNGAPLLPEAFSIVLNNGSSILSKGDVVIEKLP